MNTFIDLDQLVTAETLKKVESFPLETDFVTDVSIRGKNLRYQTQSRRQLWQAVGIEYIEPELLDYIDSIPAGDIFFDIGASNGIFSVYAMHCGLKVYAFEPEAQNFCLLEKNSYLNHVLASGTIATFNIALSNSFGMGKMFIANYEAAGHMKILDTPRKVQEEKDFTPSYTQNILKFTLDRLIGEYGVPVPAHIKIDVDGSEWALIQGARNTLENSVVRSIFIELVELSDEAEQIRKTLETCGFKLKNKYQVQNYAGLYNYVYVRT